MLKCLPGSRLLHPPSVPDPTIPIVSMQVLSEPVSTMASVTIRQEFCNRSPDHIESEYVFPIDKQSAITALNVRIGESYIQAVIEETEDSKEMYDDALSQGNTAVLAEQNDDNEMVLYLGNIPPQTQVFVELKYIVPYIGDSGKLRMTVPTGLQKSDSKNLAYPLSVDIKLSLDSYDIASSTHPITVTPSAEHYQVTLDPSRNHPNKHFELEFREKTAFEPCLVYQKWGEQYNAMVSIYPQFCETEEELENLDVKGEYIFVLDRSGSMRGQKITMAKNACMLFLKSLPPNSKFNIISFGGRFEPMFESSVPYTDETAHQAMGKIRKMEANMGGTDIASPLEYVFSVPIDIRYPRSVFLLTDGAVRNPELVINLIRKNSSDTKVHSFGIGADASRFLVSETAYVGGGVCNFVDDESLLAKSVLKVLEMCQLPSLTNWNAQGPFDFTPTNVRVVFYNDIARFYTVLNAPPTEVPLFIAFDTARETEMIFNIDQIKEIPEGEEIGKMWAKHKISDLSSEEANKDAIVDVSKRYGVPSSYTAFFGQKRNTEGITGNVKFIKVTRQIKGRPQQPHPGLLRFKGQQSRSVSNQSLTLMARAAPQGLRTDMKREKKSASRMTNKSKPASMTLESKIDTSPSSGQNTYLDLVSLQTVQGFWQLGDVLNFLNKKIDIPSDMAENVWATLLVLAFLEKYFEEKRDEWNLVHKKGLKWLRSQSIDASSIQTAFPLV